MEPFVEAACMVLERVSGGPSRLGPLGLLGSTFPAATINIVTRVDGSLSGEAVYSMSSPTAQKLAGLLTGTKTHGFGRLTGSGLAKLGVMLVEGTERILTERGRECRMSSPIVFQGLNVEFSVAEPALAIPIETDVGRVDVNVAVKNDEQS